MKKHLDTYRLPLLIRTYKRTGNNTEIQTYTCNIYQLMSIIAHTDKLSRIYWGSVRIHLHQWIDLCIYMYIYTYTYFSFNTYPHVYICDVHIFWDWHSQWWRDRYLQQIIDKHIHKLTKWQQQLLHTTIEPFTRTHQQLFNCWWLLLVDVRVHVHEYRYVRIHILTGAYTCIHGYIHTNIYLNRNMYKYIHI